MLVKGAIGLHSDIPIYIIDEDTYNPLALHSYMCDHYVLLGGSKQSAYI